MNIYTNINQLPDFNKAVITIGSFDGVHAGHQKILQRVTTLADEIKGESVVITFHPHPRKILDTIPADDTKILNTLDEKLELLEGFGIQNVVVVPFTFEFSQQMPREYVEKFIISGFHPAYVVLGYDHRFGRHRGGDITLLKEYEKEGHFKVVEIPRHEIDDVTISSTKIRKALQSGDIREANQFLRYPYVITGKVVHGDKLATRLGFPTANLQLLDKDKLIPAEGIYAVKIEIDQVVFEGMLYIGKSPTVQNKDLMSIEVNIFDFDQNIYDKIIKLSIYEFIREDIRFDNLEDLKFQIAKDAQMSRKALMAIHESTREPARITIAILNHNGVDYLDAYLSKMEYSSSKYEFDIVVIDNNSDDMSLEFLREWYPEIKIIELSKNYGFAKGYNIGLQHIETEFTVIINSDVLVTENWLDPIIDGLIADKTIGVVQPKIKSIENRDFFEYAGAAGGFIDAAGYPFCRGRIFETIEKDKGQYNDPVETFWASGAAMVIRTKLFHDIGGFDGGFFAHQEEIDLCWRIKTAGYKIMCFPSSVVYHLGGGTLNYENPYKDFLNFRNNMYMLTKNANLSALLWIIPLRLVLDGVAGIKFLLEGKPKSTLAIVRAHISFYVHLPLVFERKNKEFLCIRRCRIGRSNTSGRYAGLIVWKYFIEGKRMFSQINI